MKHFLRMLGHPDTVPILLMVPLFGVLLVHWWRTARVHDRLLTEGGEAAVRRRMEGARPAGGGDPKIHTWPYLVRIELVAALIVIVLLLIWSILLDAPLEQMADPARTPNPSKAPWYFLGLQEMLVYFDPWIAGVALPCLIIGGLCLIPYLDVDPRGNGYLCWRDRRAAIVVFFFGFFGLWLALIFVGTFFRGPGWNWFWPWEAWDRGRAVRAGTRDWSDLFGIRSALGSSLFGGATVALWYGSAVPFWLRVRRRPAFVRLGATRYALVAFLLLTMIGLPAKMALRLGLSVKYVWTTPWFNV